MEYNVNITFQANSQNEVEEKLEAFATFNETLAHDELTALADAVEEKPQTVTLIRKIIADFEGKNLTLANVIMTIRKNWNDLKEAI